MSFSKRQRLPASEAITLPTQLARLDRAERRLPLIVLLRQTLDQALVDSFEHLPDDLLEALVIYAPQTAPAQWPKALRLQTVASDELASAQGCLCCAMGSAFAESLSRLFFRVLRRQEAAVRAVVVLTQADDAHALAQTLQHAPFLGQRFYLAGCLLPNRA